MCRGVTMKKRSIIALVLIALLTIGTFVSCSSSSSSDEVKYADQDFIKSVGKGLEARWKLQDKQKDPNAVESMREAVQTELDAVSEYKSAAFEDSVLQEKALKYINVLSESLENVEYYASDKDYQKWSDVYDQRTIIIKDFADNYGLTVSDTYQSKLDELVANGKTAGAKAEQTAAIEKLVSDLNFELVEDEYDWKKYEALFENTTDFEIKSLGIKVSLLDADGVIVETAYANVDNVSKGQKAKVEFSTDATFEKMEPIVDWFDAE